VVEVQGWDLADLGDLADPAVAVRAWALVDRADLADLADLAVGVREWAPVDREDLADRAEDLDRFPSRT
jgi:hypothetical protein